MVMVSIYIRSTIKTHGSVVQPSKVKLVTTTVSCLHKRPTLIECLQNSYKLLQWLLHFINQPLALCSLSFHK